MLKVYEMILWCQGSSLLRFFHNGNMNRCLYRPAFCTGIGGKRPIYCSNWVKNTAPVRFCVLIPIATKNKVVVKGFRKILKALKFFFKKVLIFHKNFTQLCVKRKSAKLLKFLWMTAYSAQTDHWVNCLRVTGKKTHNKKSKAVNTV